MKIVSITLLVLVAMLAGANAIRNIGDVGGNVYDSSQGRWDSFSKLNPFAGNGNHRPSAGVPRPNGGIGGNGNNGQGTHNLHPDNDLGHVRGSVVDNSRKNCVHC